MILDRLDDRRLNRGLRDMVLHAGRRSFPSCVSLRACLVCLRPIRGLGLRAPPCIASVGIDDFLMTRDRVRLARVEDLPEPDRLLLLYRGLEGQSHAEVASALDLTSTAAAKRWGRLRDRLAGLIDVRGLLAP